MRVTVPVVEVSVPPARDVLPPDCVNGPRWSRSTRRRQ